MNKFCKYIATISDGRDEDQNIGITALLAGVVVTMDRDVEISVD